MKKNFYAGVDPWIILAGLQEELDDLMGLRNRAVFRLAANGNFRPVTVICRLSHSGRKAERELLYVGTFDNLIFCYDPHSKVFFSGSAVVKGELGSKRHAPLVSLLTPEHKNWTKLVKAILRNQKPAEESKKIPA